MLIGVRLLLMVAGAAIAVTFLAYLFTRNPRFLRFTKTIIKVVVVFVGLAAVILVLERLLLL